MKTTGYILTTIIFIVISSIWNGYALSVLWGWFVAGAFSVPLINIPTAIGIAMIVSYLTNHGVKGNNKDREYGELLFEAIITAITKPAAALLIGWLVTLFM